MRKTLSIIATILIGLPLPAAAQGTAQDVLAMKNQRSIQLYITGVGEGMFWANTYLATTKRPIIYCQPQSLAVAGYQYISILEQIIAKRPA